MSTIDSDGVDWRLEGKRYNRVHHRIKRIAGIINRMPNCEKAFDVGCSGGKLGALLNERISYYGCDIVPEVVEEQDPERFALWNVEKDDIDKLPFEEESFQCIVMSGLFEHVGDREYVLDKIKNLLVPGGSVVLSYANPEFLGYSTGVMIRSEDAGCIARLLSQKRLVNLFESKNFALRRVYHLSYFVFYPTISILSKLLHPFTNQYLYEFSLG